MTRALRKRLRTATLGVIACGALFWGAVDIVGVPPGNLLKLLLQVMGGMALLVALATAPAVLMIVLRQARRRR